MADKYKWNGNWHWLRGLFHFLPAASVSFIIPVFLVIYGGLHGGRFSWWALGLVCLGFGVIVYRIIYVFIRDRDEFLDLFSECKFMFVHATSAWSIGGGLACMLTGVYFFFSSHGNLFERYAGAIGIYITVIGGTLAIHAFYRHTAPITDTDVLLRWLIEDFKKAEKGGRLWIVYPALNIGYYRNRADLKAQLPYNHIFNKFKGGLQNCADRLGPKAVAITFPIQLYEPLFTCYDRMVRVGANGESVQCISDTATEARACLERFKGNAVEKFGRHYAILPREFPQHMVIVGDTVYSIMTYGMPIYQNTTTNPDVPASGIFHGQFHPIVGENKPVRLLVYRRVDVALADDVCKHLERLVADDGISIKTEI